MSCDVVGSIVPSLMTVVPGLIKSGAWRTTSLPRVSVTPVELAGGAFVPRSAVKPGLLAMTAVPPGVEVIVEDVPTKRRFSRSVSVPSRVRSPSACKVLPAIDTSPTMVTSRTRASRALLKLPPRAAIMRTSVPTASTVPPSRMPPRIVRSSVSVNTVCGASVVLSSSDSGEATSSVSTSNVSPESNSRTLPKPAGMITSAVGSFGTMPTSQLSASVQLLPSPSPSVSPSQVKVVNSRRGSSVSQAARSRRTVRDRSMSERASTEASGSVRWSSFA